MKPSYEGYAPPARAFFKEWREAQGLTQQQLGERMNGTPKGRVSMKENGNEGWDDAYLGAVAKALGVPAASLLAHPEESRRPILDAGEVSAFVRRIGGLRDTDVDVILAVINNSIDASRASRAQSGEHGRLPPASSRRESESSRQR